MASSRTMRERLAALAPPEHQRQSFTGWLVALEGAETAAVSGDRAAVQAHDADSRHHVTALGLGAACMHRLP